MLAQGLNGWGESLGTELVNEVLHHKQVSADQRDASLGMITILLGQGANPNWTNPDGLTPLLAAALNGSADVAQLLLLAGATVDLSLRPGSITPLMLACWHGHEDVALLLLEHGANIEQADTLRGYTPLQWAVNNNHLDTAALLLDRGARIDHVSLNGETALQIANKKNLIAMKRLLLRKGAV